MIFHVPITLITFIHIYSIVLFPFQLSHTHTYSFFVYFFILFYVCVFVFMFIMSVCFQAARSALQAGKSVVVDNTNMDARTRSHWVTLSREEGASIRCIVLQVNKDLCLLMLSFRLLDPRTPTADRRKIDEVLYIEKLYSIVSSLSLLQVHLCFMPFISPPPTTYPHPHHLTLSLFLSLFYLCFCLILFYQHKSIPLRE